MTTQKYACTASVKTNFQQKKKRSFPILLLLKETLRQRVKRLLIPDESEQPHQDMYTYMHTHTSKPGIANCDAKFSTWLRSSMISLLFCRPLRNSFCIFPCSFIRLLAIWVALMRKSAITSKSSSKQPLVVIAGVPVCNMTVSSNTIVYVLCRNDKTVRKNSHGVCTNQSEHPQEILSHYPHISASYLWRCGMPHRPSQSSFL